MNYESLIFDIDGTLWDSRALVAQGYNIQLKKEGFPIMNTVSGLETMKKRGFKKYCWVCNYIMIDGQRLPSCPGYLLEGNVCDDCGFCMSGEMYSVLHLKPDTITAGLSLRLG